ncbi:MAG: KpsF/GutQ family sugar-phosphate isomerase [Alphaproteobacteria bacterium]|nr:KpsF/GutQ family sugar-phosphate isomerase [Alphaproteobacteria bacterium]
MSATKPKLAVPPADQAARDLAAARRAIGVERAGLAALEAALDAHFARALELFAVAEGRVIVSGMGKSGHVARKIAATLASTGTPAQFVHPAEASHGDLGMITAKDAVLALSNSGETAELSDLVGYTRRFSIPLVAMTAKAGSALGTAADVVLLLPPAEEACPVGLAPTTSTTMQLALGDAIAVALMERRGFTAEHFGKFHPRGSLGARLAKVGELMHDDMPLATRGTRMDEVLIAMTAKRFGCVGVVDAEGFLEGIVTDGDLRRHMSGNILHLPVEAVMTAGPRVVTPDTLAAEALRLMNAHQITALFACKVSGGKRKPAGIVHIHDLLRAGIA